MADFKLDMTGCWSNDGTFEKLKDVVDTQDEEELSDEEN